MRPDSMYLTARLVVGDDRLLRRRKLAGGADVVRLEDDARVVA